jgi:hypothetical protein
VLLGDGNSETPYCIGYTTNIVLVTVGTKVIDKYQPDSGIIAGLAVNVNIYDIFLVNYGLRKRREELSYSNRLGTQIM